MNISKKWTRIHQSISVCVLLLIIWNCAFHFTLASVNLCDEFNANNNRLEKASRKYVDQLLSINRYTIVPGVHIEKSNNINDKLIVFDKNRNNKTTSLRKLCPRHSRKTMTLRGYIDTRLDNYLKTHVISVDVPQTARFFQSNKEGRNSFLTGFGMGFLAFGLKKLLLPFFIGAQLLKSVLIAMFLPSILGSLGKILGKGLTTFSGISTGSPQHSLNANSANTLENFDFKDDISPYQANSAAQEYEINGNAASGTNDVASLVAAAPYVRKPSLKTANYQIFHKIPTSSLLLTSYDPFYSPLLSRIDAVFQQLGLRHDKSDDMEKCRERLICLMYANPTKYVPYSILVSAQLSRELNELRKPSSDNPEILRFFHYMKAAKDGQDDGTCKTYGGCPSLDMQQTSPVILETFNSINKLLQARKFQ